MLRQCSAVTMIPAVDAIDDPSLLLK